MPILIHAHSRLRTVIVDLLRFDRLVAYACAYRSKGDLQLPCTHAAWMCSFVTSESGMCTKLSAQEYLWLIFFSRYSWYNRTCMYYYALWGVQLTLFSDQFMLCKAYMYHLYLWCRRDVLAYTKLFHLGVLIIRRARAGATCKTWCVKACIAVCFPGNESFKELLIKARWV